MFQFLAPRRQRSDASVTAASISVPMLSSHPVSASRHQRPSVTRLVAYSRYQRSDTSVSNASVSAFPHQRSDAASSVQRSHSAPHSAAFFISVSAFSMPTFQCQRLGISASAFRCSVLALSIQCHSIQRPLPSIQRPSHQHSGISLSPHRSSHCRQLAGISSSRRAAAPAASPLASWLGSAQSIHRSRWPGTATI